MYYYYYFEIIPSFRFLFLLESPARAKNSYNKVTFILKHEKGYIATVRRIEHVRLFSRGKIKLITNIARLKKETSSLCLYTCRPRENI